jgi:hypothetical protein
MKNEPYKAICVVTGKVFLEPEAEREIVETGMGPIWIQLWEDPNKIQFSEKYGYELIPRNFVGKYSSLKYTPEECLEPIEFRTITLELVRTIQQSRVVRVKAPISRAAASELCEQVYEVVPDDGWKDDAGVEPKLGYSLIREDDTNRPVECIVKDEETAEWVGQA